MSAAEGVVFFNSDSGPDDTGAEQLSELFPGSRLIEIDHDRLESQIDEVLEGSQPRFVAVAGGDGTIRSLASALVQADGPPLLPVPIGTRNHFSRALAIPDLQEAGRLAEGGASGHVDVGEVNGRIFVNNSSLGVYPDAVASREHLQSRLPKWAAQWVAAWEQLRGGQPFAVKVAGRDYGAWLVFVGNGAYGDDLRDIGRRESLCDGELDVRVVRADVRFSRLRLLGAIVLGRLRHSRVVVRMSCVEVEIDVDRSRVKVALDGEIDDLPAPLRYRSSPRALKVLVPSEGRDVVR